MEILINKLKAEMGFNSNEVAVGCMMVKITSESDF